MLEDFVGSGGVSGDAYFDNVTLSSVPEPGVLGFALAGLLALGWRARRPRALSLARPPAPAQAL